MAHATIGLVVSVDNIVLNEEPHFNELSTKTECLSTQFHNLLEAMIVAASFAKMIEEEVWSLLNQSRETAASGTVGFTQRTRNLWLTYAWRSSASSVGQKRRHELGYTFLTTQTERRPSDRSLRAIGFIVRIEFDSSDRE